MGGADYTDDYEVDTPAPSPLAHGDYGGQVNEGEESNMFIPPGSNNDDKQVHLRILHDGAPASQAGVEHSEMFTHPEAMREYGTDYLDAVPGVLSGFGRLFLGRGITPGYVLEYPLSREAW